MNITNLASQKIDPKGVLIAIGLILLWASSLHFFLNWSLDFSQPLTYIGIYIQTHLYTGLFITSHDAMHGTVSHNRKVNHAIGYVTSILFAFNNYNKLIVKHHEHHKFVGSDHDPDFHKSGHFWNWYWHFLKQYITVKQLILITVTMQLLGMLYSMENLILYWALPSVISTFQLFYFGTYIPHKAGHDNLNKHKSRSLSKNHFLAFISCYFFGYHYEHHDRPGVPWWQLWETK